MMHIVSSAYIYHPRRTFLDSEKVDAYKNLMSIQILKAEVIDQIAAGEVVERPSHLVKELIENSLDAGAQRIEIEVSEGGRQIRVVDDGVGMSPADLHLACARHATSKIQISEDLWSLHTFGFRGEALASIGAVCDLNIRSRHASEKNAYSIECRFGQLTTPEACGTQMGTVVEVKDLFDNVPARLKFLKSEVAEISQIKNAVKAIALGHPQVEFVFKSNSKLQFLYCKRENLLERAKDVLVLEDVYAVEHKQDGSSVEIVYSSPNATVKTSRQIWVYVQNRWVTDKTIQAAVMESYRNLLMHGEYPTVVVKLLVPTDEVDVNIHPTKSQVKFLEQSRIFKLVHATLRKDLERARWLETMKETWQSQQELSPATAVEVTSNGLERVVHKRQWDESTFSAMRFDDKHFDRTQYPSKKLLTALAHDRQETFAHATAAMTSTDSVLQSDSSADSLMSSNGELSPTAFWSLLRVVGQVHRTYIVAESSECMYMIDLHAAHERILFERLVECYTKNKMDVQNFLIPIAVDMSAESCELVLKQAESLSQMGVSLASGGPETLLVESAPTWIADSAIVTALSQFAQDVASHGGSFTWEKKRNDMFATMACHSAIRAGHVMSQEEMVSLLKQMDDYKLSSYCPHGRNVYIEISKTKLDRDFGRLV